MTNSSSFQVHKEICNALCKNKDPSQGLSRWPSGKESAYQYRRHGFSPWVRKIPWSRKWPPAPVFLPGKSHGQRSLAGYSHRVAKSRIWLHARTQGRRITEGADSVQSGWTAVRSGHTSWLLFVLCIFPAPPVSASSNTYSHHSPNYKPAPVSNCSNL